MSSEEGGVGIMSSSVRRWRSSRLTLTTVFPWARADARGLAARAVRALGAGALTADALGAAALRAGRATFRAPALAARRAGFCFADARFGLRAPETAPRPIRRIVACFGAFFERAGRPWQHFPGHAAKALESLNILLVIYLWGRTIAGPAAFARGRRSGKKRDGDWLKELDGPSGPGVREIVP